MISGMCSVAFGNASTVSMPIAASAATYSAVCSLATSAIGLPRSAAALISLSSTSVMFTTHVTAYPLNSKYRLIASKMIGPTMCPTCGLL